MRAPVRDFINGFPEAPFTEAGTGFVTGVKNLPPTLWNSTLDLSSSGFLGLSGAVDFNSYKVGTYGCDTRISCSWSASTTTALTIAPGAAAAPFRAGSSLSIGSRGGNYFASPRISSSQGKITSLAETPTSIIKPGGNVIGTTRPKTNPMFRDLTGGKDGANAFVGRLIATGVKQEFKPKYPGVSYRFNSGGEFGVRTFTRSKHVKVTVDVNIPNVFKGKFKFK